MTGLGHVSRPTPPDVTLEEGTEWRTVPDEQWRIPSLYHLCRWRRDGRCSQAPVADLYRRGHGTRGGRRDTWWAYCADHMFGRWVEDGVVLSWRAVRKAAP